MGEALKNEAKKESRVERIERLKADWTESEKVILFRRSVRLYQKEQVPEFMLRRILEAGSFAPTAAKAATDSNKPLRKSKV